MANAIELAKSYVPKLDEVYKLASLTAMLDGASDLARSLLIHTLGPRAQCTACSGSGMVRVRLEGGTLERATTATSATPKRSPDATSYPVRCTLCDDGCAVLPEVYQKYKHVVVARLPLDGWTIPQREILDWLTLAAPDLGR